MPISAANAAPERPASRIAVISGPSSRSIASPIRSATKISAPNLRIGIADWNARITPSRNEISATIGSASAPTRSQMRHTSFQRIVDGCSSAYDQRSGGLADEDDLLAQVFAHAGGDDADLLDGRSARRRRIEVVAERLRVELLQQRLECRTCRFATWTSPALRCCDQVDEQRDTRAIAVIDVGRIDDDALIGCRRDRAPALVPHAPDRRRLEAAGQGQDASAVGGVGNRDCRHQRLLAGSARTELRRHEMRIFGIES